MPVSDSVKFDLKKTESQNKRLFQTTDISNYKFYLQLRLDSLNKLETQRAVYNLLTLNKGIKPGIHYFKKKLKKFIVPRAPFKHKVTREQFGFEVYSVIITYPFLYLHKSKTIFFIHTKSFIKKNINFLHSLIGIRSSIKLKTVYL